MPDFIVIIQNQIIEQNKKWPDKTKTLKGRGSIKENRINSLLPPTIVQQQ